MSHAHELVRTALRGDGAERVHWQRLMAAMREVAGGAAVAGELPEESVAVLHSVLEFRGRVAVAEGSELPHAMPPEEMLRAHAVQALARADLERHRAAIQRVADAPESSERLAEIARWVLRSSKVEG
ncbi:MAG TPA: hypothetical protein VLA95_03135 [Gemmatimonadales bacterium]|nr:hypothetical protein [Gemmatimonadales bacterium]